MYNSDKFGMTFWIDNNNDFCYCPTFNDNNSYYTWGDGDSLDRERVRDIILEQPQFVWSN